MKTKLIDTGKCRVLFVLPPEGSYDHKVTWSDTDDRFSIDYKFSENHRGGFIMWYKDFGGRKKYPKKGSMVIVGLVAEVTEEQWKDVLPVGEYIPKLGYFMPCYGFWGFRHYTTAIEAGEYLLKANEITMVGNWLMLIEQK